MLPQFPTSHYIGLTFGCLTVLGDDGRDHTRRQLWKCLCKCGNIISRPMSQVKCGQTNSCGCVKRARLTTHGLSPRGKQSPEYTTWMNMRRRCSYPKHSDYHRYGGRGITVCERWQHSFKNFLDDMGRKPTRKHSIERKNSNGNYEPDNCVWATSFEQTRNYARNVMLTLGGKTMCATEWALHLGMSRQTIYLRKRRGLSDKQALTPLQLPPLGYE